MSQIGSTPDPLGSRSSEGFSNAASDSFSLGERAKGARSLPAAKSARTRGGGSLERTRMVLGGIGLVIAAVLIYGFMHFIGGAGKEIASDQQAEINQIGNAQDAQAKLTASSGSQAVETLYAQSQSFSSITPAALRQFEPAYSYTSGASADPNTLSVASSSNGVGLAVHSASGTCLYVHITPTGNAYGSGTTCTGQAALSASSSAWSSGGTGAGSPPA